MFSLVFIAGIIYIANNKTFGVLILAGCIVDICYTLKIKGKKSGICGNDKKLVVYIMAVICLFLMAIHIHDKETAFRSHYMHILSDGGKITAYGRIYRSEYKNDTYRYYMSNCTVLLNGKSNKCNDIIVYSEEADKHMGDIVCVSGKAGFFKKATNDGEFDAASFYQSQKIDFYIASSKIEVRTDTISKYYRLLEKVKLFITSSVCEIADEKSAGVLNSMIVGDKACLDEEIKSLYQRVGISHILAISGLHVSIIGMAFYKFLRKKTMGLFFSMTYSIVIVLSYTVMTGASVSTVRAAGMFTLTVVAAFVGRTPDLLNSLGIMLLFIVGRNPFIIEYSGFLFSVGAIVSIGIVVPIMERRSEGKRAGYWEKLWTSIAISLPMLPVVAYNYYEVPVFSAIVNLIVIPLVTIVFISGIAGAIVGMLSHFLGGVLIIPACLILKLYEGLCDFILGSQNAILLTGRPGTKQIVLFYCVVGVFLFILSILKERRICFEITRILLLILAFVVVKTPVESGMQIAVLDVGQGDAIYYKSSTGDSIFIDGGSSSKSNVGQNTILPFLKSNAVSSIAYWFVTHADSDHISGLCEVLETGYQVDNIVVSKVALESDEALVELVKNVQQLDVNVYYIEKGESLYMSDDTSLECLYPGDNDKSDDRNDMSLVLKLKDKDFYAVMAGDVSSRVEEKLVKEYGEKLECNFYKANHHGSKYSNAREWLGTLSPEITVISCAKINKYGHPSDEAVNNITSAGSDIYFTMESGQITYKEREIYENNR